MEGQERRVHKDRRKIQKGGLNRYAFLGRRKTVRRNTDREKGGGVDRYSSALFFFVVSIIGLNVVDALFTMMLLDVKAWEGNPVVRAVIQLHGHRFWIWKFGLVAVCLILLCLHSYHKLVKKVIIAVASIYLATVLYQIYLLMYR